MHALTNWITCNFCKNKNEKYSPPLCRQVTSSLFWCVHFNKFGRSEITIILCKLNFFPSCSSSHVYSFSKERIASIHFRLLFSKHKCRQEPLKCFIFNYHLFTFWETRAQIGQVSNDASGFEKRLEVTKKVMFISFFVQFLTAKIGFYFAWKKYAIAPDAHQPKTTRDAWHFSITFSRNTKKCSTKLSALWTAKHLNNVNMQAFLLDVRRKREKTERMERR